MQAREAHAIDGLRTFVLVFDAGDEVMEQLKAFAQSQGHDSSHFTGIGAFERACLGYFDWDRKDYDRIRVDEQVEVVALTGDIALDEGQPKVHAHVVLGRRSGAALGGHLLEGIVRPTLELTLVETPDTLRRRHDPASGLNLIRL